MLKITYLQKFLTVFALFFLYSVNAQVGIGTTTPTDGSLLDVESTNKGVLIPRMDLGSTLTTLAPVTKAGGSPEPVGLLVFNTDAANSGTNEGFYYWDGTIWVAIGGGTSSDDWTILGNSGTAVGTNYLGTSDDQSLAIRTNDTERIRVLNTGNVGIGDTTPAALLTVGNGDLMQVISSGHIRTINGAVANPSYSFTGDTNSGLYHSGLVDDIGLATGGVQRLWISDAGEVYAGANAPVLPGDMFNATASNINATTSGSGNLTWAINGYTNYNGGSVYGLRLAGSTGAWGAGQFELATNVATSRGAYGLANTNAQYGVNGYKPGGGTGWGGLFQNDLGYTGFFGFASDRRLKHNIQQFDGAINIISQLPIYTYQYKTDEYDVLGDASTHYGVMADELKLLVPELVKAKTLAGGNIRSLPKDKQPRGVEGTVDLVNYIELVPITIQAIKEQQLIIETQNQKIRTLETKLQLLESKLNLLLNQD